MFLILLFVLMICIDVWLVVCSSVLCGMRIVCWLIVVLSVICIYVFGSSLCFGFGNSVCIVMVFVVGLIVRLLNSSLFFSGYVVLLVCSSVIVMLCCVIFVVCLFFIV